MSEFSEYCDRFANVNFERDDLGVVEMRLHTNDGPFIWNGESTQTEIAQAFIAVSSDAENHVLIFTGTGDAFLSQHPTHSLGGPLFWERARARTFGWIFGLLDFPGPVISCINGPVYSHGELPLLADIVLAADDATIGDRAHFVSGIVPGDCVGLVLPYLMGLNRARYFHFTGQTIGAEQMQNLGLVNEVLPRERLLARAHELAAEMAKTHPLVLNYSHRVLVAPLRALISEHLGQHFALEAIAKIATGTDDRP